MMLERTIRAELLLRLGAFPAVELVRPPRQCGKTTLARSLDTFYVDLEQETDRLGLDLSWDEVVGSDRLVILDEAQE